MFGGVTRGSKWRGSGVWIVHGVELKGVGLGPVTFGVFFFDDTATTEIYTLSLLGALPISKGSKIPYIQDEGLEVGILEGSRGVQNGPFRGSGSCSDVDLMRVIWGPVSFGVPIWRGRGFSNGGPGSHSEGV